MSPQLGGPSSATATATAELNNRQDQDKSGLFQMGAITVATGRSSISQSTSANDGFGSSGGASAWLIGGGVLVLLGFAWVLTRKG